MRPIKLTMTAFGPYINTNVIDFERLGKDGIYLITGTTGAGKSTIFDAITFALYGELSDDDRKAEILRSKHVKKDVDTVVELEFEYKGARYKVRRTITGGAKPKSTKKKNDDNAPADGNVLVLPSGKAVVLTKRSSDIQQLLGLDQNQFRQTVMLAQGKFKKLLTAETKDRQAIFRSIFNTDIYNDFQNRLKERFDSIEDALNLKQQEAKHIVMTVRCDGNAELAELQTDLGAGENVNLQLLDKFMALLDALNSEEDKLLAELQAAKTDNDKEIQNVTAALTKGEKQEKLKKALLLANEQRPRLAQNSDTAAGEAERIKKENTAKIDATKRGIIELENDLPKYDELDIKLKSSAELAAKTENDKRKQRELSEACDLHKKKIEELEEESKALENAGVNIANSEAEINKNSERAKALSALVNELSELADERETLARLLEKYRESQADYEELNSRAERLNKRFNDEQAGIMAQGLRDGEPCPVCGSVHHPKPAQKPADAPSKEDVESAKKDAEVARNEYNSLSAECKAKSDVIAEKEKGLSAKTAELLPDASLSDAPEKADKALAEVGARAKELQTELAEERSKLERKNAVSELLPQTRDELAEMQKQAAELSADIAETKGTLAQIIMQTEKLKGSLRFAGKSEAEAQTALLKKQAEELQNGIDNAEKTARECAEALRSIDADIKSYEGQLSAEEPVDTAQKKLEMERLTETGRALEQKLDNAKLNSNYNRTAAVTLGKCYPELVKARELFEYADMLHRTANGSLNGQAKIKFEAYVQAYYLDKTLHCANRHLQNMTNEQYRLIRRRDVGSLSGQHALDLYVKDCYNSTERDVSSLSGGESFIASLSLALGLSDAVQQNNGGVRLDTMFVDEGFGSLSPEYLDMAMNELTSLSEANRLIGIISHVDSVKNLIQKKLVITKERGKGSKVEIIA